MSLPRGTVVRIDVPRIGFARGAAEGLPAICLQPSYLTERMATAVVVPLIEPTAADTAYPFYVRVEAAESGLARPHVAVCPLLRGLPLSALRPGLAGRVSDSTMARIARVLRLLQGL